MENPSKNIQLQLSGFPSQFDYCPGSDSVVAVSPDSISIHSLENAGSPRQIFYFDINLAPLSIFVQKMGYSPLLATLNNNCFCLWDTSKTPSTLMDVQVFRDTAAYSFDWSPLNPSLFATASTNGFASIWDRRMSLHRPAGATFLGKKVVQHLSWSHFSDIDIAALVNDEFILKWDARVASDQQIDSTKPRYTILRSEEPAVGMTWKDSSSFWILSSDQISSLTLDKQYDVFSINVGEKSNTTQSFLWNTRGDMCAVISTRRANFDTIINFFSFKNEAFVFRDNIAIPGKASRCFWRHDEDVFVVITARGQLRFFDVSISGNKSIIQQEIQPPIVEDDYFLGRQSFENRYYINGDVTKNMYAELKSLGLVDHCHDRAYLEHSAREMLHQHQHQLLSGQQSLHPSSLATTVASTTLKNIVGPRTFFVLLSEELRVLEQALKLRVLEGLILTQCDAFSRLISLDCNLSAATPGSGPIIRNFGIVVSNVEHNSNIIALSINFPKKVSHFWNMNFTIENRTHHKLDIETLKIEFVKEVQEQTQALVKNRTRSNSITGNGTANNITVGNPSTSSSTSSSILGTSLKTSTFPSALPVSRSRTVDYSLFILFNVARIFREKALHFWESTLTEARRAMSNSSFSQQTDTSRLDGEGTGESLGDGDGETKGIGGVGGICSERSAMWKQCHTPFPVLSAGFFNARGALVFFGNAILGTRDFPQKTSSLSQPLHHRQRLLSSVSQTGGTGYIGSDFVKDIPIKCYMQATHVSSLPEASGNRRHRHVSYGTLVHLREERERLARQQLGLSSGAKGLRPLDTISEAVGEAKDSHGWASGSSSRDDGDLHSHSDHSSDDGSGHPAGYKSRRKKISRKGLQPTKNLVKQSLLMASSSPSKSGQDAMGHDTAVDKKKEDGRKALSDTDGHCSESESSVPDLEEIVTLRQKGKSKQRQKSSNETTVLRKDNDKEDDSDDSNYNEDEEDKDEDEEEEEDFGTSGSDKSDDMSDPDMRRFGPSPNVAVIDAILEKGETAMREKHQRQLLHQQQQQQLDGSAISEAESVASPSTPTTSMTFSAVTVTTSLPSTSDISSTTATVSNSSEDKKPQPVRGPFPQDDPVSSTNNSVLVSPSKPSIFAASQTTSSSSVLSTPISRKSLVSIPPQCNSLSLPLTHLQPSLSAAPSLLQPSQLQSQSSSQQATYRPTNALRITESLFPKSLSLAARYILSGVASTSSSTAPPECGTSPTSVAAMSLGHRTDSLVAACRHNAQLVALLCPTDHALQQFWHLLSVALDVYQVAETEADLIRWSDSALGRNLLHRLVHYLIQRRDVQTWATLLALLGGAETLCRLLYGSQPSLSTSPRCSFSSSPLPESYAATPWVNVNVASLEVFMLVYTQCLHRWGCDLQAMQVRQSLLPLPSSTLDTTTAAFTTTGSMESAGSIKKRKGLLELQAPENSNNNQKNVSSASSMYQLLVAAGCQTARNILFSQTVCQLCNEEDDAKFAALHNQSFPGSNNNSSKMRRSTSANNTNMASGTSTRRNSTTKNNYNNDNQQALLSRSPSVSPHVSTDQLLQSTEPRVSNSSTRCQLNALSVNFPCVVCLEIISSSDAALVTFCVRCGHGGHDDHLRSWFTVEDECPAVCGCLCRQVAPSQWILQEQANNNIANNLLSSHQNSSNNTFTASASVSVAGDEMEGEEDGELSPETPVSGIVPSVPFFGSGLASPTNIFRRNSSNNNLKKRRNKNKTSTSQTGVLKDAAVR